MFKNLSIIVFFITMISACNNDDGGGGKTKSMAGASSPVVDFPSPSLSHKRTALVIGNSDYSNDIFPRLENPVNDAKDLAVVLAKLGFEVIELFDANRQQMIAAIRNFRDKLLINQGVGLFYFSGHGVDYNTKNHLIPLGNHIQVAYDVNETAETVAVDYVLNEMQMAGNHMNFLVLDACREARKIKVSNKPDGKKGMKAIPEGLKVPDLVNGFLIAYAAAPGKAALSGIGERNSPYVKHLMRFIHEPNLSVEAMFKKVGAAVIRETNQEQKPGYYTQLYDAFSFNPQPVKEAKSVVVDNSSELLKKISELANKIDDLEDKLDNKTPPPVVKKEKTFVAGKVFQDSLKDGGFGPEMVMISAGTFRMGGDGWNEKPVHEVSVDRFAMGKYEVTFAEYDKFAEATGRKKPYDRGWGRGNRPVINVSWHDATAYAKWLSDQTGKQYRLPTEAEWEYAARAGTDTKYWWGNEIDKSKANYGWNIGTTSPVGNYKANKFGLYDTSGNVWEWTCSEYTEKYNSKEKQCVTNASRFVLRGGSWFVKPGYVRSAIRDGYEPTVRDMSYGFRLVRLLTL